METSGHLHGLATLPLGERIPDTHWVGGWVGPRTGLDVVAKKENTCPYLKSNQTP